MLPHISSYTNSAWLRVMRVGSYAGAARCISGACPLQEARARPAQTSSGGQTVGPAVPCLPRETANEGPRGRQRKHTRLEARTGHQLGLFGLLLPFSLLSCHSASEGPASSRPFVRSSAGILFRLRVCRRRPTNVGFCPQFLAPLTGAPRAYKKDGSPSDKNSGVGRLALRAVC